MLVCETLKNKKSDFLNSNTCQCSRLYGTNYFQIFYKKDFLKICFSSLLLIHHFIAGVRHKKFLWTVKFSLNNLVKSFRTNVSGFACSFIVRLLVAKLFGYSKGGKCIFEICCVTFGYQQLVLYDPFLLRIEARSGK